MQKEKLAEHLDQAAGDYNFSITTDMIEAAIIAGAPADDETGEINITEFAAWLEYQANNK